MVIIIILYISIQAKCLSCQIILLPVFVCDCICASINNIYLTDDINAYECTITTMLSHGS